MRNLRCTKRSMDYSRTFLLKKRTWSILLSPRAPVCGKCQIQTPPSNEVLLTEGRYTGNDSSVRQKLYEVLNLTQNDICFIGIGSRVVLPAFSGYLICQALKLHERKIRFQLGRDKKDRMASGSARVTTPSKTCTTAAAASVKPATRVLIGRTREATVSTHFQRFGVMPPSSNLSTSAAAATAASSGYSPHHASAAGKRRETEGIENAEQQAIRTKERIER